MRKKTTGYTRAYRQSMMKRIGVVVLLIALASVVSVRARPEGGVFERRGAQARDPGAQPCDDVRSAGEASHGRPGRSA